MFDISKVARSYSPWIDASTAAEWERVKDQLPGFRRPVFFDLLNDVQSNQQIVSVAGPRRVGKSTLLRQLVKELIDERGIDAERIIYYSFDDPALYRSDLNGDAMIEALMEHMAELGKTGPAFLLLDEIQTLDRWELYLKKYYDLQYPIRIVISGSASSLIFKKSRESLLGRVKDHHVLPFSFREFLLWKLYDKDDSLLEELAEIHHSGGRLRGMFAKDPRYVDTTSVSIPKMSDELWQHAAAALSDYIVDGGFPEVWEFKTQEEKINYLFDNQVKKVITEDLVLAVEFRKPEQLKTFYISLLERPGREVSMTKLSQELGISSQQIDKYLPLLEMTDLIRCAGKFRKSAVRVRKGSQKYYPVDLALRNAVLRLGDEILDEPDTMGLYAETLVFNALKRWHGVLQIDYFRESQKEVDFIVHTRPSFYLAVEVKYATNTGAGQLKGLAAFLNSYDCHLPIVVTREKHDFGREGEGNYFRVPLLLFLLLFD